MDIVRRIQAFNMGRDPQRLRLKYRAMRASAFAFLRGSNHLFYDRLPRSGIFRSMPLTWCCGDLHLENFGSFKGDNRLAYFDINDFDEAALAPASWDLVRMLSSLRIAADDVTIRTSEADPLCTLIVDSYADALAKGKAYWVERDTAEGLVRTLLDGLKMRRRVDFLDNRTSLGRKGRQIRIDGARALPVSDEDRARVEEFMRAFRHTQLLPDFYKVLDVARRVAGTGSLGVSRYVVLVNGKGTPSGNYLLDLKESLPSAIASRVAVPQPRWLSEAHRIVTVEQRMQAVSPAFLEAVRLGTTPYVLRALQPFEDRVTLNAAKQGLVVLQHVTQTMAKLVAWAQLRSAGRDGSAIADELVDYARRAKWRQKLLEAAAASASQVALDAKTFNAAYDKGAFLAETRDTDSYPASASAPLKGKLG